MLQTKYFKDTIGKSLTIMLIYAGNNISHPLPEAGYC